MKLSNATSSNEFSISHFIMWKVYSIVSSFDRLSSRKIMQLWIRSCSWQTWSLNVSNWTMYFSCCYVNDCSCTKKTWVFVRPVSLLFCIVYIHYFWARQCSAVGTKLGGSYRKRRKEQRIILCCFHMPFA